MILLLCLGSFVGGLLLGISFYKIKIKYYKTKMLEAVHFCDKMKEINNKLVSDMKKQVYINSMNSEKTKDYMSVEKDGMSKLVYIGDRPAHADYFTQDELDSLFYKE